MGASVEVASDEKQPADIVAPVTARSPTLAKGTNLSVCLLMLFSCSADVPCLAGVKVLFGALSPIISL